MPARVDEEIAKNARAIAERITISSITSGVLCTELFVLANGQLVANELAPRPHNSGSRHH